MGLVIGGIAVDEASVGPAELGQRLGEGVSTSSPSPGQFARAAVAAQQGAGVVIVTLSRDLSASWQAATLGTAEAGGPVHVVDSGTAAGGQALVALAAARAAESGCTLDETAEAARAAAQQVRLVGCLSSLEHLVRGGRVPGVASWAVRQLNVVPMVELAAGRVRPLRPARSRSSALDRLVSEWRGQGRNGSARAPGRALWVVAMHSGGEVDAAEANQLLDRVQAEEPAEMSFVSTFGTALLAHAGPSLVGLAWLWAPPRD
jgi:DegV family protein with EDD domain